MKQCAPSVNLDLLPGLADDRAMALQEGATSLNPIRPHLAYAKSRS